jgi:hypothetical protein
MKADIFVPKDLQRDVFALQLAMNLRPIRLGAATVPRLCPCSLVQSRFQYRIADILAKRPGQTGDLNTAQCLTHRRGSRTDTQRNRLVTEPIFKSVSQNLADTPHL